jgi:hypothetical protein
MRQRRPLIEEHRRHWGVVGTVKRQDKRINELERAPRTAETAAATTAAAASPTDAVLTTDAAWIDLTDGGTSTLHSHGAGATDHGALTGLADDDHPQYATDTDLSTHAAAADPHTVYVREADANWVDLTDGGASTLHSHAGGGSHALVGAEHTGDDDFTSSPSLLQISIGDAGQALSLSASNPRWTVDSTDAMVFDRASNTFQFITANALRVAIEHNLGVRAFGYFRAGSATVAPTNTTAGDITGTRLIIPDAAILHSAIVQLAGPVVVPTGGVIRFSDADDSNYVGIRAPATAQTENWVIHLPDDDPVAGQVLSAKAVASPDVTTEWITPSGGSLAMSQVWALGG